MSSDEHSRSTSADQSSKIKFFGFELSSNNQLTFLLLSLLGVTLAVAVFAIDRGFILCEGEGGFRLHCLDLKADEEPDQSVRASPTSPTQTDPIVPPTRESTEYPNIVEPDTVEPGDSSGGIQELLEDEAVALVEEWLEAKKTILGPSHTVDLTTKIELAENLTTGQLKNDLLVEYRDPEGKFYYPQGIVKGYISENIYFSYTYQSTGEVFAFTDFGKRAEIRLRISENIVLHDTSRGTEEPRNSTDIWFRYYFELVDGKWKISDYKEE